MGTISPYSCAIEDLHTCKSNQDRLAALVEALATVLGCGSAEKFQEDLNQRVEALLVRKTEELLQQCQEEYKLLDELAHLRQNPENLK
jgi:hypothetical protein